MADYAKFTARAVFSRNSDYSDPEQDTHGLLMAMTPDECYHGVVDVVNGTTRTLIPLNALIGSATIATAAMVIRNNGTTTTDYLSVTYRDTTAEVDRTLIIPGTKFAVIPDIDNSTASGVAVTVTSNSGTQECEYFIVGT